MEIKKQEKRDAFRSMVRAQGSLAKIRKLFGLEPKDIVTLESTRDALEAIIDRADAMMDSADKLYPDVREAFDQFDGDFKKFSGSLEKAKSQKSGPAEPSNPPQPN